MKLENYAKLIKVWNLIKNYWYIPLAAIVIFVSFLIFRRKNNNPAYKIINHLKKVNLNVKEYNTKVDKETENKIEEVEEKKEEILVKIEEKYNAKNIELETEKKEQYKKELDKVKEEPKELENWFNERF